GEPGFLAVREQRPYLYATRARCQRVAQPLWSAGTARNPEWEAEITQLVQIDLIALAVHRFAPLVVRRFATRRRVVAACRGPFDYKSVNPSVRLPRQRCGQPARGNNRDKAWPSERRAICDAVFERIKREHFGFVRPEPGDVETNTGRTVFGESIEHTRNLAWDASSHEDVVHSSHHSAVQ